MVHGEAVCNVVRAKPQWGAECHGCGHGEATDSGWLTQSIPAPEAVESPDQNVRDTPDLGDREAAVHPREHDFMKREGPVVSRAILLGARRNWNYDSRKRVPLAYQITAFPPFLAFREC